MPFTFAQVPEFFNAIMVVKDVSWFNNILSESTVHVNDLLNTNIKNPDVPIKSFIICPFSIGKHFHAY